MNIFRDDNQIEISGSISDFQRLSKLLINLKDRVKVVTQTKTNEYYPIRIPKLILQLDSETSATRLKVDLDENLTLSGSPTTLTNLSESLTNMFDEESEPKDHFHLDYYEGNQMLEPTPCSLIFIYE